MHDIIDIFLLKVQWKETNILILFGGLAEKESAKFVFNNVHLRPIKYKNNFIINYLIPNKYCNV